MTYCAALNLDAGLVLASDSRTHAGVDDVSSFCKMKIYERKGDRVLVVMSSGNLAITQATLTLLDKRAKMFLISKLPQFNRTIRNHSPSVRLIFKILLLEVSRFECFPVEWCIEFR